MARQGWQERDACHVQQKGQWSVLARIEEWKSKAVVDIAGLFGHISDHTLAVYGSPIVCNLISSQFTPPFCIVMAARLSCGACGKRNLSQTGYWSHLRQSSRPACIALHQELLSALNDPQDTTAIAEHTTYEDEDEGNEDLIPVAVPFEGDAFGAPNAYLKDNFGQGEQGNNNGSGSCDDEEEAQRIDDLQQEDGWEPHRTQEDHPNGMEVDLDNIDDDTDDTPIDPSLHATPPVIVKYSISYPEKHAGKPIGTTSTKDHEYQCSLGASDSNFSPFVSKMDWEIARWAKLRGPGSTTFSELLQIEGVREGCIVQSLSCIALTYFSRFTRLLGYHSRRRQS